MKADLKRLKVLVVEDVGPMLGIMQETLKAFGVRDIISAKNGKKAYELLKYEKPDLIITDWHMPEMDGLELTRKIRVSSDSPNRQIPIIVITGFCSPRRIAEARDMGANEFLAKPFTAKDLIKRIMHCIHNPRAHVITREFVGPDRRRKQTDEADIEQKRVNPPLKTIEPDMSLSKKIGPGKIEMSFIEHAQKIMENNTINFKPLARDFLNEMDTAINQAIEDDLPKNKAIENITYPIMQIKANGLIFKYDVIGNLASTAQSFLDDLQELDIHAIEIMQACHRTMTHVMENDIRDSKDEIGQAFLKELDSACTRHYAIRATLQSQKFKKHIARKTIASSGQISASGHA